MTWIPSAWLRLPALPLTSRGTLRKSLFFSVSRSPLFQNGAHEYLPHKAAVGVTSAEPAVCPVNQESLESERCHSVVTPNAQYQLGSARATRLCRGDGSSSAQSPEDGAGSQGAAPLADVGRKPPHVPVSSPFSWGFSFCLLTCS